MNLSAVPPLWEDRGPGDSARRAELARAQPPVGLPGPDEPPHPSRASQRGLDWFVFFVADVQTGFGPFVSVYLTSMAWTQIDIGLMLTIGSLVGLAGQMPGGAIVDAARSERFVAGIAVALIGGERADVRGLADLSARC